MTTTRRTLLRSTGLISLGALAGCVSSLQAPADDPGGPDGDGTGGDAPDGNDGVDTGGDDPGSDDGGSDAGGTRPAGTGGPGLSFEVVDDAPDLSVRPSVAITRDTATADHPPQLRITVTNEGDGPVRIGEGRAIFFEYVADDDRHLLLLPADGDYPAEPDCWRLTQPIAVTQEYRIVDLAPGESVSRLVDVYGAPGHDACLPVGSFRFETTYGVTDDPEGIPDAGTGATWGFSVVLE